MEPYPVLVTLAVQVILCAVLVLVGAALLFVGWRGLRGQLPRNRYAGARTPATLRSEETFELANRAAAPAYLAAGAVGVLSGASIPMLATTFSLVLVGVIGVVGLFALQAAGGLIGHRAAEAMPEPAPAAGCGGCAGGCCSALPRS